MRLSADTLEVACFLGVENDGVIQPRASAFFIVVPFNYDRSRGRGYLVTARHNLEAANGRTLYASINEGAIGSNRKAEWLPITVDQWFAHPESAVDVVIADWRPTPDSIGSYRGTLTDAFIEGPGSTPLFEVSPGMETATVGLFSHHAGSARHAPIVRTGSIAAVPADKVKTGRGEAEAFLIETRSAGGLSGSPVFVREEVFDGHQRHPLLGLVHGHFDWKNEVEDLNFQSINTGIAVVTPSRKILEILKQPECVATRNGFDCVF